MVSKTPQKKKLAVTSLGTKLEKKLETMKLETRKRRSKPRLLFHLLHMQILVLRILLGTDLSHSMSFTSSATPP